MYVSLKTKNIKEIGTVIFERHHYHPENLDNGKNLTGTPTLITRFNFLICPPVCLNYCYRLYRSNYYKHYFRQCHYFRRRFIQFKWRIHILHPKSNTYNEYGMLNAYVYAKMISFAHLCITSKYNWLIKRPSSYLFLQQKTRFNSIMCNLHDFYFRFALNFINRKIVIVYFGCRFIFMIFDFFFSSKMTWGTVPKDICTVS